MGDKKADACIASIWRGASSSKRESVAAKSCWEGWPGDIISKNIFKTDVNCAGMFAGRDES